MKAMDFDIILLTSVKFIGMINLNKKSGVTALTWNIFSADRHSKWILTYTGRKYHISHKPPNI